MSGSGEKVAAAHTQSRVTVLIIAERQRQLGKKRKGIGLECSAGSPSTKRLLKVNSKKRRDYKALSLGKHYGV